MDFSLIVFFLFKGLEISSPIAFASLGAVFSEKGGVVNIALEGFMLITSFFIVWGAITFQNIWIGLIFALLSGIVISIVHAVLTINFKINQIISGVAINIFALGITRFLCQALFGKETQTPINANIFPKIFEINSVTFWLIPITAISWFILYKTVFGLRLRTVGENPEAADTLGISVYVFRYAGVLISGLMCGFAAATLYPTGWNSGITAGRGFIALAAMIFGRWHPVGAVIAALLFGYADTFRIIFSSKIPIPDQFFQMFPYVLAIVVLAGIVGKAKAPAADGIPYDKNEG